MIEEVSAPPPPPEHPPLPRTKIGVLLVNLGTPEAPTPAAVRRYLGEFLSDARVVDYPRWLWLPILHGVILNVRPAKSAAAYEKIWTPDGSPLMVFTLNAAGGLQERLKERAMVDWAMRYGERSIAARIEALADAGARRILVIPAYPQYSQATTASVADAAFAALKEMKWQPALRIAPAYHDDPLYIRALKTVADASLASLGWEPERVILSFHGAPKRHLTNGDPYHCHCAKTARLIREAMGWTEEFAPLAFQSKFGREEWLTPATDETIDALARNGVRKLAVMTPGFLADCLETLEEIAIGSSEAFRHAGGEAFAAIPCLNDSPAMIDLLEGLVAREAAGWL